MAWSIVGDGSTGPPSAHMRSFQLSERSLSACLIRACDLVRSSSDCRARTVVMARALLSSFFNAFLSPPLSGVGWYFGAMRASKRREIGSVPGSGLGRLESRPAPVFFMPAGALLTGVVEQSLRDILPERVAAI